MVAYGGFVRSLSLSVRYRDAGQPRPFLERLSAFLRTRRSHHAMEILSHSLNPSCVQCAVVCDSRLSAVGIAIRMAQSEERRKESGWRDGCLRALHAGGDALYATDYDQHRLRRRALHVPGGSRSGTVSWTDYGR